jgi:calcineurin-like phosphoesterase
MPVLKVIMIGDVVGESGLRALETQLPGLITKYAADFSIVNGENAAGGFGMTGETLDRILAAGADAVTGGNHIWEKREFWPILEGDKPVIRPANYPEGNLRPLGSAEYPEGNLRPLGSAEYPGGNLRPLGPAEYPGGIGRGRLRLEKTGTAGQLSLLAVNLQGREQMTPIDCPFRCFDAIYTDHTQGEGLDSIPVIVDFHAESSREKEALGYYLDGRASIVAGTHTHVQTADERILPKGTAYITDLGMTGARDGIIGMDKSICLHRARTQIPFRMDCAESTDLCVQGIVVELEGNRAVSIERISVG